MTHKPLPPTRDGFRYHWGEDDPELGRAYKQAIKSNDTLTKLIFTKRKLTLPYVKLSENDRAPQLKLDGDYTVTGEKGYCMIRATHSINRGRYYYEVSIDRMNKEQKSNHQSEMNAARIGWGQKYANLQAPLGYDQYGYSYRSRFGTKFHQARGKTYDKGGGYGEGDTIGCMIDLPYGNDKNITEGRHLPISIKSHAYIVNPKKKDNNDKPKIIEEKDEPPLKMEPLPGSRISFYRNGQHLGTAFENIYEGYYYPTISLYKSCRVSINFGPKFRYPPPQSEPWKPVSDLAELEVIDNLLSDMLYIIDQESHD